MEVKGTAFVARKKMIISQFGEEKFKELMNEVIEKEPYFKNDILPFTLIPVDKFLLFSDLSLKKFYNNDNRVYWIMGEKSAEYALIDGPYRNLIKNREIGRVVTEALPVLWKVYYTAGDVEVKYEPGSVDARLYNVPINHYHFEYVVMGYLNKILELCGAKSITYEKIKTIEKGDKEINYKFHFRMDDSATDNIA